MTTELSTVATDRLRELLPTLLGDEREGLVSFLVHLAEFDKRRGWEELNYPHLWEYCERELKLQKSCTFRRTNAARVIQRFPRAIERLRSGALTMTTLVTLKDVLTELNSEDLLTRAEWKSKDEVHAIVAELAPKPAPKPMIRALPTLPTPTPTHEAPEGAVACEPATLLMSAASAQPRPSTRTAIESTALDGINYAFRGVANKEFTEKLRRAQEILSHAVPNGDPIQVLERALDALLEKHAKTLAEPAVRTRKIGKPAVRAKKVAEPAVRSKKSDAKRRVAMGSRHIPAAVARAVRRRDGECCSFRLADGTHCGSRWKLEIDHIVAWALGGESSIENLRLACAAHNALHARRTFGANVVDRHRAKAAERW